MNWFDELTRKERVLVKAFLTTYQEDATSSIIWFPDHITLILLIGRLCELLDAYEQAIPAQD